MLWGARAVARKPDHTNQLGSIVVPTLVLVGENDPVRPLTERMQRAIAKSELVVVGGSVHGTALNRPRVFNAAVLDFWGRVDRG
jgi:pimeloyl-ACP methyl ester carboxylesterase